jgi:hypothetical protein
MSYDMVTTLGMRSSDWIVHELLYAAMYRDCRKGCACLTTDINLDLLLLCGFAGYAMLLCLVLSCRNKKKSYCMSNTGSRVVILHRLRLSLVVKTVGAMARESGEMPTCIPLLTNR